MQFKLTPNVVVFLGTETVLRKLGLKPPISNRFPDQFVHLTYFESVVVRADDFPDLVRHKLLSRRPEHRVSQLRKEVKMPILFREGSERRGGTRHVR